jgi:hypothetical protein
MPELNFDASTIETTGDFTILPVGEYTVIISASEIKTTKSGTGKYLQLTYDILEGDHKGRKVFDRLNIQNENSTTQIIAQKALSAICRAIGVMTIQESEELHDKPFIVKLGIRPATEEYEAQNKVKGYKPLSDGATPVKAGAPASTKRPWEQ